MRRIVKGLLLLSLGLASVSSTFAANGAARLALPELDMAKISAEDSAVFAKNRPLRFAIGRDVNYAPGKQGGWIDAADGSSTWEMQIDAPGAVHLNFGFSRFHLPSSAKLVIRSADLKSQLGPYSESDNQATGQLWTALLAGKSAFLELTVDTAQRNRVDVLLSRVGQGYRGFGSAPKQCKSGACNTDVACLAASDPWNEPRRAVAAITVGGTDTCTGSLVNNTRGDRRLLFATAAHCEITGGNVASVLAYFNYESPICRTPGSAASGVALPKPNSTLRGLAFLAATNNPFEGTTPGDTRSDWTLIELAPDANQANLNLFWAGWDRQPPPTTCSAPTSATSTAGLCASIHHPSVDEKRISFVESAMNLDDIAGAFGVHWEAPWDPTPPLLANIVNPPTSLPPSITEPGSSGSPLYNAQRRLIGVLSGGPSSCGATGGALRDQYGGLFHAWDGLGTANTRMRDYLDPLGDNPQSIDGAGQCALSAPANVRSVASAANRIDVSWDAVPGAERYRISRSIGSCPGGSYALIGESTGTSFSDTTASGNTTYSYQISAFDDQLACESTRSSCASATATGVCLLPPTFAGISNASSAGNSACGVNLSWSAASANCGSAAGLRYNVYRSTSAGFTPNPANRISACATALGYSDTAVTSGTSYHYVVRAEDSGAAGAGICAGIEDDNRIARSAIPAGPDQFNDDVESGAARWSVAGSGAGSDFTIVGTQSNSPTRSWFVPDPSTSSSRTLTLAAPLVLPATPATFEFFQRYNTELNYDGGILEYSLDNGATWTDILAAQASVPANATRLVSGGYAATMDSAGAFGARPAWHGNANSTWTRTVVNLADFASRTLSLRFRFGSDISVAGAGWWIDDLRVSGGTCGSSDVLRVNLSSDSDPVIAGRDVIYTASANGGSPPYSYSWDIDGDGNIDKVTTGNTLLARFNRETQFTASVRVRDSVGALASGLRSLSVLAHRVQAQTANAPVQVCGDGDSTIEPGERWRFDRNLINAGQRPTGAGALGLFSKAAVDSLSSAPRDGFGYAVTDSSQGATCGYQFIDISTSVAALPLTAAGSAAANDDGRSGVLDLTSINGAFSFYGQTVSQVVMSTNGYINTSAATTGGDFFNVCSGPLDADSNGARMQVLHDDLVAGSLRSAAFAQCPRPSVVGVANQRCLVFQWNNTGLYTSATTSPSGNFDFQAVVYPQTGQIIYQYRNAIPGDGDGATVGIVNPSTAGQQLNASCNQPQVSAARAVCFFNPQSLPSAAADLSKVRLESAVVDLAALPTNATKAVSTLVSIEQSASCGSRYRVGLAGSADRDSGNSQNDMQEFTVGASGQCDVSTLCPISLPPTVNLRPGVFFNPQRPGNGVVSHVVPVAGQLPTFFAAWYTGAPDRTPIWYIVQGQVQDNQVVAPILKATRNLGAPSFSISTERVGTARLQLLSAEQLLFNYRFDANNESGTEILNHGFQGLSSPAPNRTGTWFFGQEDGWGQTYDSYLANNMAREFITTYLYDDAGQPRWVLTDGPAADRGDLPSKSFKIQCPSCGWIDFFDSERSAGSMRREFVAPNSGTLSTQFVLPSPMVGVWNRNAVPISILTPVQPERP